jgi:hypothetical protein
VKSRKSKQRNRLQEQQDDQSQAKSARRGRLVGASNGAANGDDAASDTERNGSLPESSSIHARVAQNGHARRRAKTAESLAKGQRDISVSEFFAKNRHLLGFDNPRKALLTSVKEAVDNSLDA